MHGCSTLACWFGSHPVLGWIIAVICVFLLLVEIVWIVRTAAKSWKASVEDMDRREEQEREWKMQRYNLRNTIRHAEEWEVDASQLKTTVEIVDLLLKARSAMEHEQFLIIAAWTFPTILALTYYFLEVFWMLWALVILCIGALGWSVFHGWKCWRLWRAVKVIARIAGSA